MQNQDLTPIPIPSKQRWREFRVAYLPPLMFLVLLGFISWMWVNYISPSGIVGEVETVHANIVSTVAGLVQDLDVDLFEPVTNGQVLAVISGLDPDQLKAEIAAAEADLRLMKARMDLDKTRNLDAYSQLRITLLDEEFELDVARIRLAQAQQEFVRAQKLLDGQLISRGVTASPNTPRNDFGYEVAARDRDVLKSEVASRETAVAELQKQLKEMESTGVVRIDPVDEVVEQAIGAQRERIAQLQKPLILHSPIDGFISEINFRPGERINAGGTVLVVSGRNSDRIIAWVRPPVAVLPRVGDVVEVSRVGMGQANFQGTVIRVGTQLETISPILRTPAMKPEFLEVGLPLLVKANEALGLIPGETVQLRVVHAKGEAQAN
jgi:multidrug resistance efflux pump